MNGGLLMKKHPLEQWGSMVASKKGRLLALAFWVLLVVVFSFAWPQINSIESESGKNLPNTEMSEQAASIIAEQLIITHVYEHPQPRVLIASVARVVLRLAEQNNDRAQKIIEHAAHHLTHFIQIMLKKEPQLKGDSIVLCGGLFENFYFVQCFREKLQLAKIPNRLIQPEVPPVIGAFVNGLLSEGIPITEALQRKVKGTWMSIHEK